MLHVLSTLVKVLSIIHVLFSRSLRKTLIYKTIVFRAVLRYLIKHYCYCYECFLHVNVLLDMTRSGTMNDDEHIISV